MEKFAMRQNSKSKFKNTNRPGIFYIFKRLLEINKIGITIFVLISIYESVLNIFFTFKIFKNELFNKNSASFDKTIEKVNDSKDLDKALEYIFTNSGCM